MVATALVHGSVRLSAYTPERLVDPAVRAMLERVQVAVDPQIDRAFPGKRSARVEIATRDGRRHVWFQPDRKGDPELPLSDGELEDKFIELAAPVAGEGRARQLLSNIWELERAGCLAGLAA